MNPLDHPCKHCGVVAGEKCKNYLGKNKQSCPDRGKPVKEKPQEKQLDLFKE